VTDEEERELRISVMQADLTLKTKQAIWETPRNIAIIVAAAAGIAGVLGFKLGQNNQASEPPRIVFEPGSVQVLPAPAAIK
jgi:hypothetical protein